MTILDDLRKVMDTIDQAKPIQHYATIEYIARGKAILVPASEFYPALVVMHPDDFAAKRAELARYCRLVPFGDWTPPKETIDRAWQKMIEYLRETA